MSPANRKMFMATESDFANPNSRFWGYLGIFGAPMGEEGKCSAGTASEADVAVRGRIFVRKF